MLKVNYDHALSHAVSVFHVNVRVRVLAQVSRCGTYGGQSGTRKGVSPRFFGFPLSVSFHGVPH
jgi:hypothetical protein